MPMRGQTYSSLLSIVLAIVCAHVVTVGVSASTDNTTALPVEAFARLPAASSVKLSPDGNYLAMLRSYEGTEYLSTLHIPTKEIYYISKTQNEKAVFNWFRWANNDTLLMSVRFPAVRYGTATTETRLLKSKANAHGKIKPVFLPKKSPGNLHQEHLPQFWDNIVSILPDDPQHILLSLDLKTQNRPDVYRVNLNGGRKRVQRSRGSVVDWVADQQGRVRVGVEFDDTTYSSIIYDIETEQWRRVWEYQVFGSDEVVPLGFGQDPNILYVRAYHKGKKAIFTVDTRTPALDKTLVFDDPDYDVDGELIYSKKSHDIIGIYHRSENGYIFWNKKYSAFQAAIDKALPDTVNQIVDFSHDERFYVLYSEGAGSPGVFYIGDRSAGALTQILSKYPELEGQQLASVERVTYKARDGLEIEAYLTLPADYQRGKPAATIIHPHGGPFARDTNRFDYWTQFFANRGYIVLQPNFRGSTGYGFEFENQAVGQYGQAMQDDLIDGLNWMVAQGLTDPQRVCIVGASYGGFAALVGATKTPDTFACAVSFAGVSDLKRQRDRHRRYTNSKLAMEQYGKDNKLLDAISPLKHVKKIKVPVLLAHGSKDRVVPVAQSKSMAKALKKHKKQYRYIEFKGGSHYLDNQKHRMALFQAMDEFLAEHLSP